MKDDTHFGWREGESWELFDQASSATSASIHKGDHRALEALKSVNHLKELTIKSNRSLSLESLMRHKDLETLTLMYCGRLSDLVPLASLERLKTLCLHDLKGIRSLADLANLDSIKELLVWGSMSGAIHGKSGWIIESLQPLTKLRKLRIVSIGAVRLEQDDFDSLAQIVSLEKIQTGPKNFSFDSMARLKALRPDIKCSSLRPWDGDPFTDDRVWIHGSDGRCIRVGKSETSRKKVSATLADLQKRWDEVGAKAVAARTQSNFVGEKQKRRT